MARYPGAQWRPLGRQTEPRLTRKNIVVLHTMVGSLGGTDSYFRQGGYDGVESHFGVGHDGTVYQWQDTNYQADAQGDGNDNAISIETADVGTGFPKWSGSNVPAWTDAQVDALVDLVAWLCDTHDIPKRLIPDSGDSRRGIGYHRLGVDPWRKAGCERWSSAYGKVCPGDRRIAQIKNDIIPQLDGTNSTTPKDGIDGMSHYYADVIPALFKAGTEQQLHFMREDEPWLAVVNGGPDGQEFDVTLELEFDNVEEFMWGSVRRLIYTPDGKLHHAFRAKQFPLSPSRPTAVVDVGGRVYPGLYLRFGVDLDMAARLTGGRADVLYKEN